MSGYIPRPKVRKRCAVCGGKFAGRKSQKYCQQTCAELAQQQQLDVRYAQLRDGWRDGEDPLPRQCVKCDAEFVPEKILQVVCSGCGSGG